MLVFVRLRHSQVWPCRCRLVGALGETLTKWPKKSSECQKTIVGNKYESRRRDATLDSPRLLRRSEDGLHCRCWSVLHACHRLVRCVVCRAADSKALARRTDQNSQTARTPTSTSMAVTATKKRCLATRSTQTRLASPSRRLFNRVILFVQIVLWTRTPLSSSLETASLRLVF